jgi:hypothetical protein
MRLKMVVLPTPALPQKTTLYVGSVMAINGHRLDVGDRLAEWLYKLHKSFSEFRKERLMFPV